MADYAAQLYTFGHELKSLVAYQKVLHEDPLIFDKDAKHIWNLAEIHLVRAILLWPKLLRKPAGQTSRQSASWFF